MTSATVRPYREFGAWLRSRRLARRWTQEELARRLNYGVTYVRKIEWGERRPSDGLRVRLAQVLAVPLASLPPALRSPPAGPVPVAAEPLVGRAREMEDVVGLFAGGCRLVTLVGPPGIGKTRLAAAVASHLDARLPGGASFVPLAEVVEPGAVARSIGQVLGVPAGVGNDDVGDLMDRLRPQDMLLVLDNFEHVMDAAPLVADLVATAPSLRILVTSRQALDLISETPYVVPPLAVPDNAEGAPAHLAAVAAIALFAARAARVQPHFSLGPDNLAAVAQICIRLQGIPLAIELAAGAMRFLTPETVLTHLGSGLDLPVPGPRDAPLHQRTLRAAIGWSFDLLRPGDYKLMTRLAVFPGGCSVDAAAEVCRLPGEARLEVRTALLGLAAKSLLETVDQPGGTTRFVALESVRAFALERLEALGELSRFQRRHAAWVLALVEGREPQLTESGQAAALAALDHELANIRAALAWSMVHDPVTAICICAGLWRFWWIRGYLAEGRRWLDAALHPRAGDDHTRALALAGAGVLARTQGDYDRAVALLESASALARSIDDRRTLALAALNRGIVAENQGDHAMAWTRFEDAKRLYRSLGDRRGMAHATNCLATVRLGQGDLAAAAPLLEQALVDFEDLRDDWSVAMVLGNLGWIAHKQEREAVARSLYEKSLAIYRGLGDERAVATVLVNLGASETASASEPVTGVLEEALLIHSRLGERRGVAECMEALANAVHPSDAPRAALLLGAAERLRQRIGAPLWAEDQTQLDGLVEVLTDELGAQPFAVCWQRGRILSEEEVVAVALAQPGSSEGA